MGLPFLTSNITDTILLITVLSALAMVFGLGLRKYKQPYIIGYILIGIALGENGIGLLKDADTIRTLGEIGIILLLFFIGSEINLPELVGKWKIAILGTIFQILLSVLIVGIIGYFFDWSWNRSLIIGFIIALSSSAVIIRILEDKAILDTKVGKQVISILLMQDILVVPLLITSSFLGGKEVETNEVLLMAAGGLLTVMILVYIYLKRTLKVPFHKKVKNDQELQVFLAILCCFGGALFASFFQISPALGAFIGGLIIHASKATQWIHDTLHSFRILFVALFFISIGLQIDFGFIWSNLQVICLGLLAVYITNHLINSVVLKMFGGTWAEAFYGGALLAQIGELAFLLSFTAYELGVITSFGFDFTISLISLTLLISPFWISGSEYLLQRWEMGTDNVDQS